jgi:hypothetical protein
LSQLQALAARNGDKAAGYAGRNDAKDGMRLQHIGRFDDVMQGITQSTLADADRAKSIADSRQ